MQVSVPLFGAISEIGGIAGIPYVDAGFRPLIWGYLWNALVEY